MKSVGNVKVKSYFYPSTFEIPFPYFQDRPVNYTIDTLILHRYTAPDPRIQNGETAYSAAACLRWMNRIGESPHFVIDQEGNLYDIVEESKLALHCKLRLDDKTALLNTSALSVGIIACQKGLSSAGQISRLRELADELSAKYPIKEIKTSSEILRNFFKQIS